MEYAQTCESSLIQEQLVLCFREPQYLHLLLFNHRQLDLEQRVDIVSEIMALWG